MFFRDIIGQEAVKRQLLDEIHQGRIPHARLISGPEGTGKLPLAIAYARYIHCEQPGQTDGCGKCPSCVKFNKLVHPDVHFIFPIVKKGKKETCDDYIYQWRELLTERAYFNLTIWLNSIEADNSQAIIYGRESEEIIRKLSLRSSEGGYKTTIVWLPEKMHVTCANKLLKLLEEPPEHTIFLLVSESPEMILPTIISRTQSLRVQKTESAVIERWLTEKYNIMASESRKIAHAANGNVLKALEAIEVRDEHHEFFELFVSLMRLSYQRKIQGIYDWSKEVTDMGREKQKRLLEYCQHMIRESFIYNLKAHTMNYMNGEEENFTSRFSPFVNEGNVMEIMEELSQAQRHIEQNVSAKMVFFDFGLRMIVLLKNDSKGKTLKE